MELMHYCDSLDCTGITSVLNDAVSGFGGHEVRFDHLWRKQGTKALAASSATVSNIKELFPDKS
jgi:hypothetical protein